ncbi:XRE family transcriptional regulator [Aliiroseovarius sp. S2029]|uniref:XRE family transcriptional regulator n=1 Tax=Aliiroseovarius sp. S2029 TaxID=2936988 RepID=UPI0020BF4CDF|nr:XRE family transcriptional regulator [Aliiroseovarius sp. S2029]MCK8482653.1 XRE family transcriptional regulator [Aliiroseovarius sp. S2029]
MVVFGGNTRRETLVEMNKAGINPEILVWARLSAGFSEEEAAQKLGLKDTAKQSAIEKLELLETGEKQPTRSQLAKIATAYSRPLLTFYLNAPPAEGRKGEDFRQTASSISKRENAMLDVLRRDVRARQEMVRSIIEDDDEPVERRFVGSARIAQGVSNTVQSMAQTLEFNHTDVTVRRGDPATLFRLLRTKAESSGVFVLMLGDLGSWHSAIPAEVFRGFAISDPLAPFVVLNTNDAVAARSFTLIHELAHLWLGQSGVSGAPSIDTPSNSHAQIEQFCNDVAGEFLLPDELFWNGVQRFEPTNLAAAGTAIATIAQRWSVSEPMVAYRLRRRNEISSDVYQSLYSQYLARWQAAKAKEKAERKDEVKLPDLTKKKFRLGSGLLEFVHRTVRDNGMTYTKAAKVLGTKPGAVEPLLKKFESSNGSFFSATEGRI